MKLNAVLLGTVLLASSGFAQTTLPAGSNVDGDFSVGNSTNKGGLTITGQTGNTAAPGIKVTGDGGVVFEGTYGTGQIPTTGAGTRFMWYPKKAALRVGRVTSTQWDESNIGTDSIALGYQALASGINSAAFGGGSRSSGVGSASIGGGLALGDTSIAIGKYYYIDAPATASGMSSVAIGSFANAFGFLSMALMGTANNDLSIAISGITDAQWAIAIGGTAAGEYSLTLGEYSIATGIGSTSVGYGATSSCAYSVATGRNSVIEGSPTTWIETDPLFVIGNGTGNPSDVPEIANRNAFVVKKNGDVLIPKRQGDILMGEFGSPE